MAALSWTPVWVLHISHKHGDSFWAFTSQEKARRRIEAWCKEWWGTEIDQRLTPEAMGLAGEDMVELYFEKVSDRESYRIEEVTVDEQ